MTAETENVTLANALQSETAPMWLKVLVVVLGIAIVGMLALILFKIVAGSGVEEPSAVGVSQSQEAQFSQPVQSGTEPLPPQDFDIVRPEGASLLSVRASGADVIFHFRLPEGSDQIIILDRRSGAVSRVNVPLNTD